MIITLMMIIIVVIDEYINIIVTIVTAGIEQSVHIHLWSVERENRILTQPDMSEAYCSTIHAGLNSML